MTLASYIRIRPASTSAAHPLTAQQVARAYNFPSGTGAGRKIAIIELGGGFGESDLSDYFGHPMSNVTAISVGSGENVPDQDPNGADGEVLLDIEVALSIAAQAECRVYFCGNSNEDFLAGIEMATSDLSAGDAISISWGGPETSWDSASMDSFDAAFKAARTKGINVFCAAGDSGADDGTSYPVADFPASSPNVVACGGTRLTVNSDGTRAAETTWDDSSKTSATGGGLSRQFPGRQVPDVAGNADPDSGYEVVIDGQSGVVGGTSAVAPLYAGLCVLVSEMVGTFDFQATVTANPTICFDVTVGSNGAYRAGPGRDQTTGFGVVDGTRLVAALGNQAPSQPSQPSQPTETLSEAVSQFLTVARGWAQHTHDSPMNKSMWESTKEFIAAVDAATT